MIDSEVESNKNTPTTLHQVISEEIIEAPFTTTLMRNANMVWKSLLPRTYSQQVSVVENNVILYMIELILLDSQIRGRKSSSV